MISSGGTATLGLYDLKNKIDILDADKVSFSYSEINNSISRTLADVVYDLVLDVTWFGAKADHSFRTGLGTDNSDAFNNTIAFIGSLGSIRDGGKVKVKIPSGSYQLKHLNIPTFANMGFGIEFFGDGQNNTALYFDETYATSEAITCLMQGVIFKDLALFGHRTSVGIATGRTLGFKAKLSTLDADIDVTFNNCSIRAWDSFIEVWGRGFVFKGGMVGGVQKLLTIKSETYNNSTPTKPNNIMRHYRIQNTRIDAVGTLIDINGTNTAQQINDLTITGNDFYSLDKLLTYDGYFVNGLVCSGNNQLHSFATAMIRGTHLKNSVITSLGLLHRADTSAIPTTDGECVGKLVDLLGDAEGNLISNNVIKNLRENIVHIRGNAIGNIVLGNSLSECFSRSVTASDRILCRFDGPTRSNNIIKDNACSSSVFTGVFKQTNIPIANLVNNIVKGNTASWVWGDAVNTVYLNVFAGATDITGTITNNNRICRFIIDGDYIVGALGIIADTTETGAISASLPVLAISDLPTVTSGFGGGGAINDVSGFNVVGYTPSPIFINSSSDRFEFFKVKDLVKTPINWSDGVSTRSIRGTFRYRFK